jgi:1-acyl-sn-glycerol-3-phosphate acyltransferase
MRAPTRVLLSAYDYLVLYLGLAWLGLLCLAWTPIAWLLWALLPERRGLALGRYVSMAGFRLYLASLSASRRCSFDLSALDVLRGEPALILAPNHPSLLDAVMIISRMPNVTCVLKAELMNNVFLGGGARLARYIRNEPVRCMIRAAIVDLCGGSHLLLFPEGTRSTAGALRPLKGSVGVIAHQSQVPVQTILIETDSPYLSKGWPLFRKPSMPIHYRVRLGRRFEPPQHVRQFMTELGHYFAQEMIERAG